MLSFSQRFSNYFLLHLCHFFFLVLFRSDRRALEQGKKTNFLPTGRPKAWKMRCVAVIRKSIENR